MDALAEFDLTLTFCLTPPSRGRVPHHTSPPNEMGEFAQFSLEVLDRYVEPSQMGRIGAVRIL
jgi:hypothetical protein